MSILVKFVLKTYDCLKWSKNSSVVDLIKKKPHVLKSFIVEVLQDVLLGL